MWVGFINKLKALIKEGTVPRGNFYAFQLHLELPGLLAHPADFRLASLQHCIIQFHHVYERNLGKWWHSNLDNNDFLLCQVRLAHLSVHFMLFVKNIPTTHRQANADTQSTGPLLLRILTNTALIQQRHKES